MHVGLVTTYPPAKCGIGIYSQHLVQALMAQDISITVLAEKVKTEQDPSYVHRCWHRNEPWPDQVLIQAKQLKLTVVHVQHEESLFGVDDRLPQLCRQLVENNIRPIVTLHSVYRTRDFFSAQKLSPKQFHRALARAGALLVVHQKEGGIDILLDHGLDPSQIACIAHGTEMQPFLSKTDARLATGLPPDRLIVLSLGFLHPRKGVHTLLKAFPEVAKKVPNALLLIVGETRQRNLIDKLYTFWLLQLMKPGLNRWVEFRRNFTPFEHVQRYVAASDVMALAYRQHYGSASGVLHLALGSSKPVICARQLKFTEAFTAWGDAWPQFFPEPGSISQWSDAIIEALTQPAELEKLQQHVHELGEATSWPKVAKRHQQLYFAPSQSHAIDETDAITNPKASVIIRSYRRPHALIELIAELQKQDFEDFEIVVLEQTDDAALLERLNALNEPRLHVVVSPPIGAPAARNEALRHARGDIFVLVDDDDLPQNSSWLRDHLQNYHDPQCMGVVGRLLSTPTDEEKPKWPRLMRLLAMRMTFFKDTCAYAGNTLRKQDIDFLIGSNASVRRALVERVGGWDENVPMNEELSFAIRYAVRRKPGDYLVFDPKPSIWRRTHIDGGLERRTHAHWYIRELEARWFYYDRVVGYYFPIRFRVFMPLFALRCVCKTIVWIWDRDNSHRALKERLKATLKLAVKVWTLNRSQFFRDQRIKRVLVWP